jgi:alpha-L-arabinofuranosidase
VRVFLEWLEYCNAPANLTTWSTERAKNGHPKPFNLKYIEIGNENGGDAYAERWPLMANSIHAKYPDIKLIANEWSGGHPKTPEPEIIDEHYYNNPDWFIWNANQYDKYDRKGPKIFIGEYAVNTGSGNGNLRGAIAEAAWMAGMERNSDIVVMGSYAPLLCNSNHKAWPVNMINYDSYRWFGLPSYYVQKLFSNNQGTVVLPSKIENAPMVKGSSSMGCIGLGTWMNAAEFKDVTVTSPQGKVLFKPDFSKVDEKWRRTGKGEWSVSNGVLKQSAIQQGVTLFMGDSTWKDITITLKAKRVTGENGFQIYYHNRDNSERFRWDIGGWGNSQYYMELGMKNVSFPGTIEVGRWYDVKIEIKGSSVKGYLDGKLVQEIKESDASISSLFASSVKDEKSGDIILKIINVSEQPVKTTVNLNGAEDLTGKGTSTVLTSANALDENTLENPTKVFPKTELIKVSGSSLTRSFPGNSLTVIRLGTKK